VKDAEDPGELRDWQIVHAMTAINSENNAENTRQDQSASGCQIRRSILAS
jgi:hypothetical protein